MRQVLPMKPFARAMRYGPFFLAYWKNLVCAVNGTKHCASALGPLTILGPCCACAEPDRTGETSAPATRAATNGRFRMDIFLLLLALALSLPTVRSPRLCAFREQHR